MGVRENTVEKYLNHCFTSLGGLTRKWVSPGRDGVPDRICILNGVAWYVEVKTVDGKLSPQQIREHERLTAAGANVRTVYGVEGVDELMIKEVHSSNINRCPECNEALISLISLNKRLCGKCEHYYPMDDNHES